MKIKDYMPSIYVKRCLWRRVILACMLVSIIDPLCWAELKDSDLRFKGKVLEPVPWRANKKLFDQLKQERKVYIEVKSGEFESGADQLKTLNIHGAIVITENAKKAYTEVCKFNFLNGLSSFIKEVVWVPQKKHLKVRLLAFNYGLDLNFKYILRSAELQHDLLLEVEDGPLKGLSTLIRFEDYRRKYTVMSIQSFFKAEEFPFPRFFLTFGIEIVLKNIAIKLRSYLENQKTGANP